MRIDEIMAEALDWDGDYRQDFALVIRGSFLDPDEPVDWDWIREGQDEIAAMRAAVAAGEALHVVPFLTLVDAALQLPVEERRLLDERLQQSLDEDPNWPHYDEETLQMFERRIAEVESGAVKTIPFEEAMEHVRAALKRQRGE